MRRLTGERAAVVGAAALVLLLAGCASPAEAPAVPPAVPPAEAPPQSEADGTAEDPGADADDEGEAAPSASSAGTATAMIDGREFTFDLRMCSVYDTGEALVAGLGGEVGSDVPSHLDGDAVSTTYGEFRIDIGAEGPFESSDDFLSIGSSLGGDFTLEQSGDGHVVTGHSWDTNGADLGTGTLHFTCT